MTGGLQYGISPLRTQGVTVADSNLDDKSDKTASSPASSPDELVKDPDVKLSEDDESSIVGGRKAGKGQQEFMKITMKETLIT